MANEYKNKSDAELYNLLGGKRKKSRLAFDELYNRYSSKIFAYCLKVMGSEDPALDVFQETFVRFYASAKKEKEMTNVNGYLIKIARNLCLNEKSKRYNDSLSLEDLQLPVYNNNYDDKQLVDLLKTAIDDLPLEYKEALVMKEFMDMSYKDIAESLDTTLPVVRIRIYRAKNKLRQLLSPYMVELDYKLEIKINN